MVGWAESGQLVEEGYLSVKGVPLALWRMRLRGIVETRSIEIEDGEDIECRDDVWSAYLPSRMILG